MSAAMKAGHKRGKRRKGSMRLFTAVQQTDQFEHLRRKHAKPTFPQESVVVAGLDRLSLEQGGIIVAPAEKLAGG